MRKLFKLLGGSMLLAVLVWVFAPAAAAGAAAANGDHQVVGFTYNTATIISLVIGYVLPLAVAFVSRESWNATVKGLLLLAFSGITSVLSQWLDALNANTHFAWQNVVVSSLLTFATGAISHSYIWKPGGAAAYVQRNMGNTESGLGTTPAIELDPNFPQNADSPAV